MSRIILNIMLIVILMPAVARAQVKVRIFADRKPSAVSLSVDQGRFELDIYDGSPVAIEAGSPVILALYEGRIAVKLRNSASFMIDSLTVRGLEGNDRFFLRINGNQGERRHYSGSLKCYADLGVMVLINICSEDDYIAGVVRTEGGPGKRIEYHKSLSLLARTYLYRHFDRHLIDGYNICDNIHCQAFNGISSDSLIMRAVLETRRQVILAADSSLIISAFHSNCGGETCTSDFVWLSSYAYLKNVNDPYCIKSPNAHWKKTIPLAEWESYLRRSGFNPEGKTVQSYNFVQDTRQKEYRIGSFSIPFNRIRNDLNLKSSFFSVSREGNSVILRGRGYGHGVGLCQEGAMVMAARGFKSDDIIKFYYSDVIISDVKNAKALKNE
ncbi:MAG TPA: SpoIID/LytB domain-containing protein [Bacteroidales bacterium]|jgi:stage II sporulation protein D|nr:SpoIID/LytB domain-containing protein [Bacteroidales bacterium]MZP65148.1 SpoIID/LytB domain-containing protein [Bacteroidales bacterium]NLK53373.1 SpoIID/LytB domain-containing protein [Bacteroidales bacterium]HNY51906.1 SpoIID/LytB domain-containing protein [Bacteroidales bacterium]HOG55898.1 SpoIID/LytB domain-containing protein [Bacteroidales bacterium]